MSSGLPVVNVSTHSWQRQPVNPCVQCTLESVCHVVLQHIPPAHELYEGFDPCCSCSPKAKDSTLCIFHTQKYMEEQEAHTFDSIAYVKGTKFPNTGK